MKFSKELEEMIDRELAEYEQEKREGKVKFLSEEEAIVRLFGENVRGLRIRDFANGRIPEQIRRNF